MKDQERNQGQAGNQRSDRDQQSNKNQQGKSQQPQGSQSQNRGQQFGSQQPQGSQRSGISDQQMKQHKNDPATVPATKQDKGVSNDANFKGAVNTGQAGTKPTASQQQGQGAKNAKDHNNRSDSGQNTNKKDR